MNTLNWPDASAVELGAWPTVGAVLDGDPKASCKVLREDADGKNKCGLWSCTPGTRKIVVSVDEFCYFIEGRGSYIRDDGEVINVSAGTVLYFPAGWAGTSVVTETIKKAFMRREVA